MSLFASLEPKGLSVEPGGEATAIVRVRNRGSKVERFEIRVVGATARWTTVDPPALRLFPPEQRGDVRRVEGEARKVEGEARIVFRPPRASAPLAGEYPFGVSIVPVGDPDSATVEEGRITVSPFVELASVVVPQTSRASRAGRHELTIQNRGNIVAEIGIAAEQGDNRLRFDIVPEHLGLVPEGKAKVRVVARPKDSILMGQAERLAFEIKVSEPTVGTRPISAALDQRPILPNWLKPAAGLAVAGVLALAFLPGLLAGPGDDGDNASASGSPSPIATTTPSASPPISPSPEPSAPPSEAPSEAPSPSSVPTPGELTLAVTGDDFELSGDLSLRCPPTDQECREDAERTVVSILQALLGSYGGSGLNAPDEPLKAGTLPVRASWEGPFPYTFLDTNRGFTSSVAIDLAPLMAEEPGYVYAVLLDLDTNVPRRFVVPGGVADQLFETLYQVPDAVPVPTHRTDPVGGGIVIQPSLVPLVDWDVVYEKAPIKPE